MNTFITYWVLKIFTFVVLLVCGYQISYKKQEQKNFWMYGLIAGFVYSLNYGLRWNRAWDYPHYYQDLTGHLYTKYTDITYLAWIELFKYSSLPYWVAFIFYSAILFYGFLLILKRYPYAAAWALPLFFTFPTNVDNFIRQFFATAFLFIGYYFMEKSQYKKMFFFYLLCVTIHFSGFFAVTVFLFFKFFKKLDVLANSWLLISIFLLLFFFWDVSYLDSFGAYVKNIGLINTRANEYIDSANYWFTQSGDINLKLGNNSKETASRLYITLECLTPVIIIFWGVKVLKENPNLRVIFWSSYLAILINILGGTIEIYSRFYCWLVCFEPVLVGIIMSKVSLKRYVKWGITGLFVVYFYYYHFLSYIQRISLTGYDFIWDR